MTLNLEQFDNRLLDGLEFCRLVYAAFEGVRASPGGAEALRTRPRPVKRLLEELLPIARYVQTNYGPGTYIAVRWIDGNQRFDAELELTEPQQLYSSWPCKSTVEVTQAAHTKEYLSRELLNRGGPVFGAEGLERIKDVEGKKSVLSNPTSYQDRSYIQTFAAIALNSIRAKVAKDYPDNTALIVDCELQTAFFRDEWNEMVEQVRDQCPAHRFREIFLTAGGPGYAGVL
jgi:hypothetical protein